VAQTIVFLLLSAILSALFTRKIRSYAIKRGIQDLPTQRSLHNVPTPRGGGLAIVLTCLIVVPSYFFFSKISWPSFSLLSLIFASLIAWVGWIDDKVSLNFKIRLLIQLALAGILCTLLFQNEVITPLASLFLLVWMTNLYNFMDGIDGIAGAQATFVSFSILLFSLFARQFQFAPMLVVVAGASLGFLFFNWQPAKIFMGDVGSTFLGFFLGAISLLLFKLEVLSIPTLLILWATFFGDATFTLLRRLFSGVNVTAAHRDHAYQHAVMRGFSHRKVVLIEVAINFLWLLPLAIFSSDHPNYAWVLAAVAYFPIVILALYLKAGKKVFN
jgi:Fuc2NAc and GlcNAc transferase